MPTIAGLVGPAIHCWTGPSVMCRRGAMGHPGAGQIRFTPTTLSQGAQEKNGGGPGMDMVSCSDHFLLVGACRLLPLRCGELPAAPRLALRSSLMAAGMACAVRTALVHSAAKPASSTITSCVVFGRWGGVVAREASVVAAQGHSPAGALALPRPARRRLQASSIPLLIQTWSQPRATPASTPCSAA